MREGSAAFRQALRGGLLWGAAIGVLQGLEDWSVGRGVIRGIIFGAVITALGYAGLRVNSHLVGLSPREQRMVVAAVRRGRPVTDPALTSAAVRHAQKMQIGAGGQRLGQFLAWVLLAVSVVALGVSVATAYLPGVGVSTISSAIWVLILVVGPKLEGRLRERARAAEVANSQLVQPPPGGAGSDRSRPWV